MQQQASAKRGEQTGSKVTLMRLEMREWEASRSRTESPWSASRRRLSESRLEAARVLRSPTVDAEAGVGTGKGDADAERGDLVLGVKGGEAGGGRKPRPTATGDGDASLAVPGYPWRWPPEVRSPGR